MSAIDDALAHIDAFDRATPATVAWQIDRAATLARLRELVRAPEKLDQRGLNACGPAVFFRIWLARDPLACARFACALLRDGSASIGARKVAPSWKILGQRYALLRQATDAAHPNSTPEPADWMLLTGLRDSENIVLDYAGEPFTIADRMAGATLPSTLVGWLEATGLYRSISNETNLVASGDRKRLSGLLPTSGTDIALFIAAKAIYDLEPKQPKRAAPKGDFFAFPDHYVLMRSPIVQWDDPDWIEIDCWSWGRTFSGWQSAAVFVTNYFGTVVAQS